MTELVSTRLTDAVGKIIADWAPGSRVGRWRVPGFEMMPTFHRPLVGSRVGAVLRRFAIPTRKSFPLRPREEPC